MPTTRALADALVAAGIMPAGLLSRCRRITIDGKAGDVVTVTYECFERDGGNWETFVQELAARTEVADGKITRRPS